MVTGSRPDPNFPGCYESVTTVDGYMSTILRCSNYDGEEEFSDGKEGGTDFIPDSRTTPGTTSVGGEF